MFHFAFAAYMLGNTTPAEQPFLGGIDNSAEEVDRPVASVIAPFIANLGVVLLVAGLARPVSPVIANAATILIVGVAVMFFWLGAWPVALVVCPPESRAWVLTRPDARHARFAGLRVLYRFVASRARLAVRSGRSKNVEIIVLGHQLTNPTHFRLNAVRG